jgi:hypothetical protein
MLRPRRVVLWIVALVAGLMLLVALAVPRFVDVGPCKSRLEAVASDAMGMDVRIGGRLGVGFLPGFHVTMEEGRILDDRRVAVASARRAVLWIDPLPMLLGQFRLRRVQLVQPRLFVERDLQGRFNVERLRKAAALLGALEGASVSLSDGTLLYADRTSGKGLEATGFDLTVSRIGFAGRGGPGFSKGLSLEAQLGCGEIRTRNLSVSALKATVHGKNGRLRFEPVTMRLFGGRLAGNLRVDVSGPVPRCQAHVSLPHFRIEEFLRTLSPKQAVEGTMDFSASLSMQGNTARQIVRTAAGEVSLRGEDLVLEGNDLDRVLSRFESSQNFNLVDVGAVLLAGPLGLAVTKGYDYASLFRGSGGSSRIRTLASDWRIERGVARAADVALATARNRIALQGGLDFVNGRFADVTVAAIDARGCARVRQAIHGSFVKPVVEKPRVLTSLAGPVLGLYRRTRRLFPAGPCEAFYSGSVAAPASR